MFHLCLVSVNFTRPSIIEMKSCKKFIPLVSKHWNVRQLQQIHYTTRWKAITVMMLHWFWTKTSSASAIVPASKERMYGNVRKCSSTRPFTIHWQHIEIWLFYFVDILTFISHSFHSNQLSIATMRDATASYWRKLDIFVNHHVISCAHTQS